MIFDALDHLRAQGLFYEPLEQFLDLKVLCLSPSFQLSDQFFGQIDKYLNFLLSLSLVHDTHLPLLVEVVHEPARYRLILQLSQGRKLNLAHALPR